MLFILIALEYWNNLLWPLIVFRQVENMPLAVGMANMVNQYKISSDLLVAGSALVTLGNDCDDGIRAIQGRA